MLKGRIKRLITGGEWSVVFRNKKGETFSYAPAPENQWCADPFVYEENGEHFIFVEQYLNEKEKGCIGYYQFEDGVPINKGVIIENDYHMSYPNVFKYKEKHFMIPESSANSTVDLYSADVFPDKWRKEKTLLSEVKLVDSTIYQEEDKYYLITYSMTGGYEVLVYELNMIDQELSLLSKKKYKQNVGRPGGRLFVNKKGKLIRPAQDCSQKYGEALIMYQVDELNKNGALVEHEIGRIRSRSLRMYNKPERVHQLTRDSLYEVFDVYKEKIDLLHVPRILFRSRKH